MSSQIYSNFKVTLINIVEELLEVQHSSNVMTWAIKSISIKQLLGFFF
jgi:hypothetical protein